MQSTATQENGHQEVFYRELYICAVWLDILIFEQISLFYSSSNFNLGGGLGVLFRRAKPTKAPRDGWTVWKNFSLLFNAIDSEKYLGYAICQACKICQTFCLYAWQGPKSYNAFKCPFCFEPNPVLGLFCLHLNTIGWSSHMTSMIHRDNWLRFKSLWLRFRIRIYAKGSGSSFRFRGSMFRVRV